MRVIVHAVAREQVVALAQDVEHGLALLPQVRLHRHDLAVDLKRREGRQRTQLSYHPNNSSSSSSEDILASQSGVVSQSVTSDHSITTARRSSTNLAGVRPSRHDHAPSEVILQQVVDPIPKSLILRQL